VVLEKGLLHAGFRYPETWHFRRGKSAANTVLRSKFEAVAVLPVKPGFFLLVQLTVRATTATILPHELIEEKDLFYA